MHSEALSTRQLATLRQPVGAEGLPPEQAPKTLKALTCAFAPLAGLEPATYGLVEQRSNASAVGSRVWFAMTVGRLGLVVAPYRLSLVRFSLAGRLAGGRVVRKSR